MAREGRIKGKPARSAVGLPPCDKSSLKSAACFADFQARLVTAAAKWGSVAIHHRALAQFLLAAGAADLRSESIRSTQTQGKNKCRNLFHLLLSMSAIAAGNGTTPVVKINDDFPYFLATKSNIERDYFRVNISFLYIFILENILGKPVECGIWRDWEAPNVYTILAPHAGKRPAAGAAGRAATGLPESSSAR
ncbi:hypothetical protein [Janthinobacterium sp. 1_2014MBL_MicDiv]|uniref:hypothetical protein n=1 Tax=Janthinobacterium sp. 1_2014MBL_MicDiv TaxID=1644131 RepID=UPI0012EB7542|nr:hypothetical protein [Janthinobacterium sp. 1_2014MBL_MicDiv]